MKRAWLAWGAMWTGLLLVAAVIAVFQRSDRALTFAASTLILTAALHSILGERFILQPLFRRGGLPRLFRDQQFVAHTLRFVWHLFSIAFIGLAAILIAVAAEAPTSSLLRIVAATAAASAVVAAAASRGRHLSWVAFSAVAFAALRAS